MTLLLGIASLIVAYLLASHDHPEGALFCVVWGALFTFLGLRGLRRWASGNRQYALALEHNDEVITLSQEGKSSEDIAAEFQRRHKIAPIITLQFLASQTLRAIGRDFHTDMSSMWVRELSSGRREPLPPPKQSIESLDLLRDLHTIHDGVRYYAREGWRSIPARGWLVALRDYLLFLPYERWESLGEGTVKEFLTGFLPPWVGLKNLAEDAVETVTEEMKIENREKLIAEFLKRCEVRDSFVVPWRDIVRVWKKAEHGWGPPRTYLMIAHGDATNPTIRKLSYGRGYGEVWVDNWIENIRVASVLEGVLLEV